MTVRQFGHYELEALIGVGGMGEVWRAKDTLRDRTVALKLLPETLGHDADFASRFRRESHVAARLREPHVVPIHDYGEIDGRLYIDMRLVDGRDLSALLRDGPIAPARAIALMCQVADALEAAHADGLVHRDIKPSNVLVTANDFVYVVDFGIARSMGSSQTSLTMTGATVGTLDYMAPERFTNQPLDGRVDVYSLACVLAESLTAARPFHGEDLASLLYAHLYLDPPRPSQMVAGIPPALDDVIARGMAKRPEDRYSTPGELIAAARVALDPTRVDVPAPRIPVTPAPVTTGPLPALPGEIGLRSHDGGHRSVDQLPTPAYPAGPGGPPAASGPSGPGPSGPMGPGGASYLPPSAPAGGSHRGRNIALAGALVLVLVAAVVTYLLWPNADDGTTSTAGTTTTASGLQVTPGKSLPTGGPPTAAPPPPAASIAVPTIFGDPVPVNPTPGYMEVAPNGRYAYIANRDEGIVTVFDTTSNAVTATIPIPQGPPQFITFSPDGSVAYVTIYNADYTYNAVAFVETASNTVTATVEVGLRPFAPATSPDGGLLYVPLHNEGRVEVLDTATATEVDSYEVAENPHWIAISDDGSTGYTANHESGVVSVLDLGDGGRVITTIPVGEAPHSISLSPDGTRVSVVNFESSTVSVIDTATNTVVATIPVGAKPQDITYAPDGAHFYTANVDGGTVSVIDTKTNTVTATIPTGNGPSSVAVLPDGRRAYVTNLDDGTVRILDLTAQ
jgi:YVTN family beta-propeller protein